MLPSQANGLAATNADQTNPEMPPLLTHFRSAVRLAWFYGEAGSRTNSLHRFYKTG